MEFYYPWISGPLRVSWILWILFSYLPGNFTLKNGGDFWWIFSGLRLPWNKARKILEKFGENWEQNSGRNIEKFGELSFCNFPDLNIHFSKLPFCNRSSIPECFWTSLVFSNPGNSLVCSGFRWSFGEGLLKDKFAFFFSEAYNNPTPKRRKLLAKRPFI